MRAWRFVGVGKPLELQEVERPEPGRGEVVVDVRAAGLCHSDVHILSEQTWNFPTPLTLGHEGAGVVTALGDGVDGLRVGDRVAVYGANPCGRCGRCNASRHNLCERREQNGLTIDGCFADAVRCRASGAVPLPDGVSFEAGAIATDAILTPFHALHGVGHVQSGERVAIFGMGGLGLHALQIAKDAGARVTAIDISQPKRDAAVELGADAVAESGAALTDEPVDLVLDLVGNEKTHGEAQTGVRPGGRVVLVGLGAMFSQLAAWRYASQEISLLGSFWGTRPELEHCLAMLADGRLSAIVERAPLDSVNEQIERLTAGDVRGRVALVP